MSIQNIIPSRLGFDSATLTNIFRRIPEHEAYATVESAWYDGIRYFENTPNRCNGLAEIRLGNILSQYPRSEYIVSTSIGQMNVEPIKCEQVKNQTTAISGCPTSLLGSNLFHDYSEKATIRSIENSLQNLKMDYIDIVWVHFDSPTIFFENWEDRFKQAVNGAFSVLNRQRDQGIIKAWGLSTNSTKPIEFILNLEGINPDGFLLTERYSLLDHDSAIKKLMPRLTEKGLSVVVKNPYCSGTIIGNTDDECIPMNAKLLQKFLEIKKVTDRFDISMKSACLQFALANPVVAALLPGASTPSRIAEDTDALFEVIPDEFWHHLREQNLVNPLAELPIDHRLKIA